MHVPGAGDAGARYGQIAIAGADAGAHGHAGRLAAGRTAAIVIRRQADIATVRGNRRIHIDLLARLRRQSDARIAHVDGAVEVDAVQGLQGHVAGRGRNQACGNFRRAVRRRGRIRKLVNLRQRGAGGGGGDDGDIVWIEQPVAHFAAGRPRTRINPGAIDGQVVARRFDETAIAAQRAASRRDTAKHARRLVAPDDDLAALAAVDGVGGNAGILVDQHLARILHGPVPALVVAAQQNRAAARGAAGIDLRVAEQAHLVAQHLDFAPLAGRPRGRGHAAGRQHRLAAGLEHDLAVVADDGAVGIEHAALADQRAGHADAAALGDDLAQVQRLVAWCGDQHAQLRIAGVGQLHAAPRRQDHFAIWRRDDARVFHVRRDQQHLPALARVDDACIADAARDAARREFALAGKEVGIRHAQAGRHQAVHIHFRALAEDDAIRVDQEHLAVRFQAAEDLAGVLSRDAVEHGAIAVLLDEARDFTGMDGKALPVDDGVGGVRDREDVALLIERRLAMDHLRQGGIGLRRAEAGSQQQRQRRAAQRRPVRRHLGGNGGVVDRVVHGIHPDTSRPRQGGNAGGWRRACPSRPH